MKLPPTALKRNLMELRSSPASKVARFCDLGRPWLPRRVCGLESVAQAKKVSGRGLLASAADLAAAAGWLRVTDSFYLIPGGVKHLSRRKPWRPGKAFTWILVHIPNLLTTTLSRVALLPFFVCRFAADQEKALRMSCDYIRTASRPSPPAVPARVAPASRQPKWAGPR